MKNCPHISRTRPVIPQEKKDRLTQTLSLVPGRVWAGAARHGRIHPLCTPAHAPTAKSGAKTPQRVSAMGRASYRLVHDSVPWWLRADVRERSRRAVCTRKESFQHTAHSRSNNRTTIYSQHQQQTDPTAARSSTQQQRRRGSGGGQLRASEPPIVCLKTSCLDGCALFGSVTYALGCLSAVLCHVCSVLFVGCFSL